MRWWNMTNFQLRHFENKLVRDQEYEEVKNRMERTHTTKQSVIMILKGIFFAITLTSFEYASYCPPYFGQKLTNA